MKSSLLLLAAACAALAFSAVPGRAETPAAPASPPLTLAEAIRLALEKNPDLRVDRYGPQIARADVLTALGQFDPTIDFKRSYAKTYQKAGVPTESLPSLLVDVSSYSLTLDGQLPGGLTYSIGGNSTNEYGPFNRFTNTYQTFEGVSLTQPLLRGFGLGASLANVRVARANRAISDWQYRQNLLDTVTNVVDAYSQLLLAHDRLRIAVRARELASELEDENEKRLKAGSSARSDVTTAQARVASLDEGVISAQYNLIALENAFRELIGEKSLLPGPVPLVVAVPDTPQIDVHPAEDYQHALANRPDYQAARWGIVINRANNSAAWNGLLPKVNLTASYGYNGLSATFAESRRLAAQHDVPSSSIGVDVSIPLTDATGRGQARAARLKLRQSEDDLKRLEADIAVTVANSGAQIASTHQRVVADQKAYQLTAQALQDEENKLRDGTSSTQFVITAQQNLVNVDNSVASALDAERQAIAAYDRHLGRTLARYGIDLSDR